MGGQKKVQIKTTKRKSSEDTDDTPTNPVTGKKMDY